jgi:peptidoglycan/LPS O-acetylase OafA/YrhL
MAKRIEQLDGIRAVAIGAVFIHHMFQAKLLWMGVDLFFILSGFLITGVLINAKSRSLKEYFGHFYSRRARRILPPYVLLLVVTSLFFGIAWATHWYYYILLMNFMLVFGVPHPGAFDVLWSLAVEEQFYLVWPFVIYFCSEEAIAWVAGAIFFAAPLLRWFCTPLFAYHWPIYELTPFRMDLLAIGALVAILWRKRPYLIQRFGHYSLILSGMALLALYGLSKLPGFTTTSNTRLSNVLIYELTLIICTGGILWALSGRGIGILMLAPVRYIGRISYTIYLIHLLARIVVSHYLHGAWAVAGVTLVVTLLYSAISWAVLEKPLLSPSPKALAKPFARAS